MHYMTNENKTKRTEVTLWKKVQCGDLLFGLVANNKSQKPSKTFVSPENFNNTNNVPYFEFDSRPKIEFKIINICNNPDFIPPYIIKQCGVLKKNIKDISSLGVTKSETPAAPIAGTLATTATSSVPAVSTKKFEELELGDKLDLHYIDDEKKKQTMNVTLWKKVKCGNSIYGLVANDQTEPLTITYVDIYNFKNSENNTKTPYYTFLSSPTNNKFDVKKICKFPNSIPEEIEKLCKNNKQNISVKILPKTNWVQATPKLATHTSATPMPTQTPEDTGKTPKKFEELRLGDKLFKHDINKEKPMEVTLYKKVKCGTFEGGLVADIAGNPLNEYVHKSTFNNDTKSVYYTFLSSLKTKFNVNGILSPNQIPQKIIDYCKNKKTEILVITSPEQEPKANWVPWTETNSNRKARLTRENAAKAAKAKGAESSTPTAEKPTPNTPFSPNEKNFTPKTPVQPVIEKPIDIIKVKNARANYSDNFNSFIFNITNFNKFTKLNGKLLENNEKLKIKNYYDNLSLLEQQKFKLILFINDVNQIKQLIHKMNDPSYKNISLNPILYYSFIENMCNGDINCKYILDEILLINKINDDLSKKIINIYISNNYKNIKNILLNFAKNYFWKRNNGTIMSKNNLKKLRSNTKQQIIDIINKK